MRKKQLLYVALACLLAVVVGNRAAGFQADPVNNAKFEVGRIVSDFSLPDVNRKTRSLSSLKGAKATVILFIGTKCPVSNGYNERLAKLAASYQALGVNFVGINANFDEPIEDVQTHAAGKNLTFPVLKDAGSVVADQLGAQVTPEAYLLDANNKLVYRGRIDNSRRAEAVTSHDLRDAIDAALAGKTPAKTQARAFGCGIKRTPTQN